MGLFARKSEIVNTNIRESPYFSGVRRSITKKAIKMLKYNFMQ